MLLVYNTAMAINAVAKRIFANQTHETVPYRVALNIYAVTSVAGLKMTLSVGGILLIDEQPVVNVRTVIDRSQDLLLVVPAAAGQQVIVDLRATAALTPLIQIEGRAF